MAGFHEYDAQREEDLIATLMAWKPAALVVTGITPSRRVLAQLSRVECPLIQMWDIDGTPIDSAIGFSNSAAGRMAAQHLVERGHRDIAIVSATNLGDPRARARATAFFETARKLGVEVRQIEAPDRSMTAGALFMREAVARKELPAALAFSGDSLAMGALLEAQRLGISVPDDIAVIGYGDLEFASLANPGLTTIRPPHEEMGAAVAEHIRKRLKDISSANETIDLGVKLIVREST
jgi:LacI family gluconate utilization system Gnt-I transcriptional repressor